MPTGTIKKCYREKGYSFIIPDDGSPDIFAPSRSLVGGDEGCLKEGLKVMFESEIEARTNKPKAVKWSIIDGAAPVGVGAGAPLPGMAPAYGAYVAMPGAMPMTAAPYGAMMPGGLGGARYAPYGAATAMAPAGYGAPMAGAMPAAVPAYGGAPVAAAALPPGWEQGPDPSTGKMYYFNRATGESSWTPPAAPGAGAATAPAPASGLAYGSPLDPATAAAATAAAASAPQAAPAAASAAPAPSSGDAAQAQTAVAALPEAAPAQAAAASAPAATPAPAATAEPAKLPEGWETTTDPSSGRPYFFNRATGETTWSPPQC